MPGHGDTALEFGVQCLGLGASVVSALAVPIPGLSEALKAAGDLLKKVQASLDHFSPRPTTDSEAHVPTRKRKQTRKPSHPSQRRPKIL